MNYSSPEVFVSKELNEFLEKEGDDSKFVKWINDMKEVLKENRQAGQLIEKKKIPKFYIKKYGVTNLVRYRHPEGYRSCYTIIHNCPHILDLLSHKEYEEIFGY